MVKEMPLDIGMRVDVLDDEGIWNTGMIVDVGKEADEDEDKVEVKYDGWGDDYNQWVSVATQRLAPLHTYTIVKKCWAKLTKWPWWPAFVVLRAPTTALAAHGLEEETKLYVEFYDSFNEDKRSRCWMQKKNVVAFRDGFEERASKNIGKNFPKFVEGTQRAKAGTSPLLFSGPGTLPIEYSSKMAEPLEEKKKECSAEQWFHLYRDFSNRYKDLYGYSTAPVAGKRTSPSPALKSGKRGPGRPKKVVQEQSEDDDESEEKEEEPEAGEPEESAEEEEEEAPASGRRSTRRNKRPAAPAAPSTRRSTRARRVKVIEVLTQTSSSMVASCFSPPPSVRDASSRSSSMATDSAENAVKAEVRADVELEAKAAVQVAPAEPKQPTAECAEYPFKKPKSSQKELASLPDFCKPSADHPMDECKPETPFNGANCSLKAESKSAAPFIEAPAAENVGRGCRRKDVMEPPAKLSERLDSAKTDGSGDKAAGSEQDPDFYKDWSGGSRYELDSKPWNILGWFVRGIENRLHKK